jgi:DNA-binding transcriptional MerR regulator
MTTTTPTVLTMNEVSELTRVPAGTLRYWRHQGTGPRCFKAGRRILYFEADALRWLEETASSDERFGSNN